MTTLLRLDPRLFAKAEYENPTGSVKDRAARFILDAADLSPGSTVIEPTSGNMGIALAALCRARKMNCIIVMPDSMSRERREMIISQGAKVVLTPGKGGHGRCCKESTGAGKRNTRQFSAGAV